MIDYKFIQQLFIAFICFSLICSCANDKRSPEKIHIKFWINPWIIAPPGQPSNRPITNTDFPEWICNKFMEKYPEIQVDYTIVSNKELKQKISAALAAGNPPDIFKYFDLKFAQAGILEPIDEYLTEFDKSDFIEQCLKTGEFNGKHYLWPWNYGTNGMGATMLLYKERFIEKGIDIDKIINNGWTTDEFLEICRKLTAPLKPDGSRDYYALALSAKDDLNILGFIYNFGGQLFDAAENKIILNSPETVKALDFLKNLIKKYNVCPAGAEAFDFYDIASMFHNHKTAIFFGGPYEIGRIYRNFDDGKLAHAFNPVVAPFPTAAGVKPAAHISSGGFIVFKQNDNRKKKYVIEFAKFLTAPENIKLLESINYITARKSANKNLYQKNSLGREIETYTKIIEKNGISLTGSEKIHYSELKKYLVSLFETVFQSEKSTADALNEFDGNVKNVKFKIEF